MTAKEYLGQIMDAEKEIRGLLRLLEMKRTQAEGRTTVSGNGGGGRGSGDRMADAVVSYVRLEKKINRKIDAVVDMKEIIGRQIEGLKKQEHKDILRYRYIDLLEWKKIAEQMNYSEQNCYVLHGKALREFGNKYRLKRLEFTKL